MATTRLHSGSTGWPERTRMTAVPRLGQTAGMLIGAIALGGCAAALAPIATVGMGSIVVTGRTPADIAVSAVIGLDCSLVRLGDGKSYCKQIDPPAVAACILHTQPSGGRLLGGAGSVRLLPTRVGRRADRSHCRAGMAAGSTMAGSITLFDNRLGLERYT